MYTDKVVKTVTLIGLLEDGSEANTRQGADVVCFVTEDRMYKFSYPALRNPLGKLVLLKDYMDKRSIELSRLKVEGPGVGFSFQKSIKYKYYEGTIDGQTVRVALNKIRGELRYMEDVPVPDYVAKRFMNRSY